MYNNKRAIILAFSILVFVLVLYYMGCTNDEGFDPSLNANNQVLLNKLGLNANPVALPPPPPPPPPPWIYNNWFWIDNWFNNSGGGRFPI